MEIHALNSIAVLQFVQSAGYPRLTADTWVSLHSLLNAVRNETGFHGVVIMSNGQSFATGADISEVAGLGGRTAHEFARLGQGLCESVAKFPLPVVAGIRGFCLGGGMDLALACHARIAAFDSAFGYPGGALGLVTGWGGTQRLPRLVGKPPALQMLLTGERIPATQALTMGLVDELAASQDLEAAAVRFCERLAQNQIDGDP